MNEVMTKKLLQETERVINRSMPDYAQADLLALLRDPSAETWDKAHGLNIGGPGFGTLWQAIRRVDHSFPGTGPVTVPRGDDERKVRSFRWEFWPENWQTALGVMDVAGIYLGDDQALATYNAIMARVMK